MNKKQSKKFEESKIIDLVNHYKVLLCQQIKSGKSFNQEGLLFDSGSKYNIFWKLSTETTLSENEREIVRINFILSSLNTKEKEIIWNEFFFNDDKFWWMSKYNRSTYYRIRAKAIDNFYLLIK